MTAPIKPRLFAREVSRETLQADTIIRFITLPGHSQAEPDYASVGEAPICREHCGTAPQLLSRVKTAARLAVKPGA